KNKDQSRPYLNKQSIQQVSSYFYPVNSAIFIENPTKDEQLIIMTDRSQAGSAYQKGRIELLVNRFGNTNDELGMYEAMVDQTSDGKGPNVTLNFHMAIV